MNGKNKLLLSFLVLIAIAAFVLSTMNVGTGIVHDQSVKALSKALVADVSVGGVKGNPVKGYVLENLVVKRGADSLLSVPRIEAKPGLLPLLSGRVYLDRLVFSGIKGKFEDIKAIVDGIPPSKEPAGDMPVGKIIISESEIVLPTGDLKLKEVEVIADLPSIKIDLDGAFNGLSLKGNISGIYDGTMALIEKTKLNLGSGQIILEGDLLPDLSATADVKDIDLEELSVLWPGIKDAGCSGKASSTLVAKGSLEKPILSGLLKFDGQAASIPVKGLEGEWRYENLALEVPSIKSLVSGVPLNGSLSVQFGHVKPKLMLKMIASKADLTALRKTYADIPSGVSGVVDEVILSLDGPIGGIKGVLKAKAEKLIVMKQHLKNSWASVILDPSGKSTVQAKTILAGQPVYLNGSVIFKKGGPVADLLLKSRGVKTSFIEKLAGQSVPITGAIDMDVRVKGALDNPAITGKLSSPKISGWGQGLTSPSVSFALTDKDLKISSATAKWSGANLSMSGKISDVVKSPMLAFKGNFTGLNLPALETMLKLSPKTLQGSVDGSISVGGSAKAPTFNLNANSGKIRLSGVLLSDLSLKTTGDAKKITISEAVANIGKGKISASGTVSMDAESALDIKLSAKSIEPGVLVKMPLSGKVDMNGAISGPLSKPDILMSMSSPQMVFQGVALKDISGELKGKGSVFTLSYLKAFIGGSPLELKGIVDMSGSSPSGTVDFSGKALNLTEASKGLVDISEYGVGGVVSLLFKGSFEKGKGSGSGSISSPALSLMNIKMSDILCALNLNGSKLTVNTRDGNMYGGSINGSGWLDFKDMSFSRKITLSNVDLAPLVRDYTGGKGTLSGKLKVNFAGSGKLIPFKLSGKGTADLSGGKLVGYPVVDVAAKLHGASSLNYKNAHCNFRVVDTKLLLDKGTVVNARDKDPIYRYLSATGVIGPSKKLKLACLGDVNVRMLNAVAGAGIGGIVGGGVGTLAAVVDGIMGGAQQGAASNDFRDIVFTVGGSTEKPSVGDFKIGPSKLKKEPEKVTQPVIPVDKIPAILDKKPSEPSSPSQPTESVSVEDQIKDKLEEEAGDLLKDFLGGGKKD